MCSVGQGKGNRGGGGERASKDRFKDNAQERDNNRPKENDAIAS